MTTNGTGYVGRRLRRKEDPPLITGKGVYTDDMKLTGMLYAAFVRSPEAHARIVPRPRPRPGNNHRRDGDGRATGPDSGTLRACGKRSCSCPWDCAWPCLVWRSSRRRPVLLSVVGSYP